MTDPESAECDPADPGREDPPVVLRAQHDRAIEPAGVERDLRLGVEQGLVGDDRQSIVERDRRDRTDLAAGDGLRQRGRCKARLLASHDRGDGLHVELAVTRDDRQHELLTVTDRYPAHDRLRTLRGLGSPDRGDEVGLPCRLVFDHPVSRRARIQSRNESVKRAHGRFPHANSSNMEDSCRTRRFAKMTQDVNPMSQAPMSGHSPITRDRIAETERLIRPYVRRTPVMRVDLADFGLPARPVDLKLEFLQHTGSFKVRGAFTNLLTRPVPPAGVVAASGGNHGVAVAYAARQLGKPATIFLPTVTSPPKAERIRGY